MKKTTSIITTLGLFALLSCVIVFYLSCKKKEKEVITCTDDCSHLSDAELAFLCYTQGQKVIFKNDTTNILDTLIVLNKGTDSWQCTSTCEGQSIYASFAFSHLEQFNFSIPHHNSDPNIYFPCGLAAYGFVLNVPVQTIAVNSTVYNDIYSVQGQDSAIIRSWGDQFQIPWKIYYSKSQGFVRFYMLDGQTWSKL
jgi:hypothetical protein